MIQGLFRDGTLATEFPPPQGTASTIIVHLSVPAEGGTSLRLGLCEELAKCITCKLGVCVRVLLFYCKHLTDLTA